ncbi:hypothetical protein NW759_014989 [Fusarium solani]|nr:hypothetical protein NW759_014989 [Fusarium solani]
MTSICIPKSSSTVKVSIIDTTFVADVPAAPFMGPAINGFERFRCVAYAFLITHKDVATGKERKVIFDLGSPTDLVNDFPPTIAKQIEELGGHFVVSKHVSEILTENGVPLEEVEALIWSHAHCDHIGKPSLWPSSTKLVVGPGLKEAYYPGWPNVEEAPVLAREFEGRDVIEIDLASFDVAIGDLKAMDFFGDGSFYLISAPGHAMGHLNALARTSGETFLYLGADSFHHASQLRPHAGSRLPATVRLPDLCCAGSAFHSIHPLTKKDDIPTHYHEAFNMPHGDVNEVPFHTPSQTPTGQSLAIDLPEARRTIRAIQKLDQDPNILVIAAHDSSLYGIMEYFPVLANDWKEKQWKEKGQWAFLSDLSAHV